MRTDYLFGDTDEALARLDRLATAYAPSTRRFLRELIPLIPVRRPRVLDLGCGPGNTIALLGSMLAPSRLVGYDLSDRYVQTARDRCAASTNPAVRRSTVLRVDVTGRPPDHRFDVVFARHVLAHLAAPLAALASAASALVPGGVIAIEETAGLSSDCPHFARYYALVAEVQRAHGQQTDIGRSLGDLARAAGLHVIDVHVRALTIPAVTMAALHAVNITAWGADEYARSTFDHAELDELRTHFVGVAAGSIPSPSVAAPLGQAILTTRRS
jgi:trans-aconitate 2-methyltransferase